MESGRATSQDMEAAGAKYLAGQALDLARWQKYFWSWVSILLHARSVNYLDLSKLGNEGETPNSDEIWVTVEDDNKFLTSDTETYSVATDKVSTMATFKGHVGSQILDNSGMLRR